MTIKNSLYNQQGATIKIFLIISMEILLLGIVSAGLSPVQQEECKNIITNSNSSAINITEITSPSPNSEIIIRNVPMTKVGSSFNYTFCNTTKVGVYDYGYCDFEGNCYSNDFEVTESGSNLTTAKGMIYIASILSMLFVAILFFLISSHVEGGLKFGFIACSLISALITILYSSVTLSQTLGGFAKIVGGYSIFLYAFISIFIVILIFVFISLTKSAVEAFLIKRGRKGEE